MLICAGSFLLQSLHREIATLAGSRDSVCLCFRFHSARDLCPSAQKVYPADHLEHALLGHLRLLRKIPFLDHRGSKAQKSLEWLVRYAAGVLPFVDFGSWVPLRCPPRGWEPPQNWVCRCSCWIGRLNTHRFDPVAEESQFSDHLCSAPLPRSSAAPGPRSS